MPRGDKSAYTDKQKRKAEHIEEGYERRGLSENEAERRAWATVNAMDHGGKKSGSGRGKRTNKAPARDRWQGCGADDRAQDIPRHLPEKDVRTLLAFREEALATACCGAAPGGGASALGASSPAPDRGSGSRRRC